MIINSDSTQPLDPHCSRDSLIRERHSSNQFKSTVSSTVLVPSRCKVPTLLEFGEPKYNTRSASQSYSQFEGIRKLLQKHSYFSSHEKSHLEESSEYSLPVKKDSLSSRLVRRLATSTFFQKRDESNTSNTPSPTYSTKTSSFIHRGRRASSSPQFGFFRRLSSKFNKKEDKSSQCRLISTCELDCGLVTSNIYEDLSLGVFEGQSETPRSTRTLPPYSRSLPYSVDTLPIPCFNIRPSSSSRFSIPMLTARRGLHNLSRGSVEGALSRGLVVAEVPGPLPASLSNAIQIIPQRLYWVTNMVSNRPSAPETHFFSLDNDLVYESFFADFGPLNLGNTYRYCELLKGKMSDTLLANKRIVHYTCIDIHKRANAAYLMVAFCVVILGWSPEAAAGLFEHLQSPLLPFRDATYGTCSFPLTIMDCARGLNKAISLGWFDFDMFDIATYEYLERLENGDLNWIIPKKFVAFSGPEESRRIDEEDNCITFTPNDYIPTFKKIGVKMVIRLNKKQYDRKIFTSQGIEHVDLYFLDGSCPSKEILYRFIDIAEREEGAIAVHCKAGLGRTGTLIGCYAMKHYGFTGPEWIAWNRICRPGSVLGPQQHFLCEVENELRGSLRSKPAILNSISDTHTDLADLLQEMSLNDRKTAEQGDLGQGRRLVNSKRRTIKTNTDIHPSSQSNDPVSHLEANDEDEEDVPAYTPAYARNRSNGNPNPSNQSLLTPTSIQSPVTKLPRRVQPEDTLKPVSVHDHLPLLSHSIVNSSINKSN